MNTRLLRRLIKLTKIAVIAAPIIAVVLALIGNNTITLSGAANEPGGDPIPNDPVPI